MTTLPKIDFFAPALNHYSSCSARDYQAIFGREAIVAPNSDDAQTIDNEVKNELRRGVAIAGAGFMGISIAATFIHHSIPVLLYDISEEALQNAPERIARELTLLGSEENCLPSEKNSAPAPEAVGKLLKTTSTISRYASHRFPIETIYEKLKVKQKFYQSIAPFCTGQTILLTNTSTLKIDSLVANLETTSLQPKNCCGFHFFHPVHKRSLIEIIQGPKTSPQTVQIAASIARTIGKLPLVVRDGAGFLVNRLLNTYLNESLVLVESGVSIEKIEEVCRRFGMAMGPFRIMDEIGLDVTLHSGWAIKKSLPESVTAETLLPMMLEDRRLGRKNGRGFRLYPENDSAWQSPGSPDPDLQPILERAKKTVSINHRFDNTKADDQYLAARLFLPLLLEAGRAVQDRIVDSFALVDAALTYGLGFPVDKGGIVYWAESVGLSSLLEIADRLQYLGRRYDVPENLRQLARKNHQ